MISICFRRAPSLPCGIAALALACGSPPPRDGLFGTREKSGGTAGSAGSAEDPGGGNGGATVLPDAGAAGDASIHIAVGGSAGQGGVGGAGGAAPELDAGALDATAGDAATNDAGQTRVGCLPADQANCDALSAALVHRYSFEGTGSVVADSVGTANGSVVNGQLSGSGTVQLSGDSAPENYVNLPNGIVSSLNDATFEAWVNWDGGAAWQRIFDFGSSQDGEDRRGGGDNYVFLTPRSDDVMDTVRLAFKAQNTGGEVVVDSAAALPSGVEKHLAVVVNGQNNTMALFIDGVAAGSIAFTSQLSALDDFNNWLGRSAFDADPGFAGSIAEFRIYSSALNAAQVALSFDLGPDALLSE